MSDSSYVYGAPVLPSAQERVCQLESKRGKGKHSLFYQLQKGGEKRGVINNLTIDRLFRAYVVEGFPGGSSVKNPPALQEIQVQFLGQEDPQSRIWHPTPVFLPGKPHGQRSRGLQSIGLQSPTRLSD